MKATSLLASVILGAAVLLTAAHAQPPTTSGPKKLLNTYMASSSTLKILFPGFTVVDNSAVNCPNNVSSCTIGFESEIQVDSLGDMFAICLQVDSMPAVCHNQVSAVGAYPTIAHAREAVENLAPGPHTVQTLVKEGSSNGNDLYFFHTDYRVYKP